MINLKDLFENNENKTLMFSWVMKANTEDVYIKSINIKYTEKI